MNDSRLKLAITATFWSVPNSGDKKSCTEHIVCFARHLDYFNAVNIGSIEKHTTGR